MEAAKEEIKRIKEEEEQAMREALGLAPKRSSRPQGNRLDKHEFQELVKRGSTAEDLGAGHAEAAHVQGLGFARAPRSSQEESSSLPPSQKEVSPERVDMDVPKQSTRNTERQSSDDERSQKKRKREERRHEKREKRHSRDSDDKSRHKRDKGKRRHDSD